MECFEDFQSHKVKKMIKWIELDGKGFSLPQGKPHNDSIVTTDVNMNNQLKVLTTDQLRNYVGSTYNNVGIKSKYE